jgi:MFS family permease
MLGIGTVLMISGQLGTYGVAGVVAGTTALAGAVVAPQISRLIDTYGQGRVLRPVLALFTVALTTLIVAVRLAWPEWTWFVAAAAAGATLPSIGSMVRARWAYALPTTGLRDTAFALESALDEVIFVIGPPLATLLATTLVPEAGLLALLVFALGGGLLFAARRESEPPPVTRASRSEHRGVFSAGMVAICSAFVAAGVVFGAMEVTVVAYADEHGVKSVAGLVLAAYAAGSLFAGLFYGARTWHWSLPRRFTTSALVFGAISVLPALAPSVGALAVMIFLTGLAIAPVLIGGMTLVERLVPRAALTEGLTWSTTSLTFGVTIGAAVAGPLIDTYGAHLAFRLPAGAAILTALIALASAPVLQRAYARVAADAPDRPAVGDSQRVAAGAGDVPIAPDDPPLVPFDPPAPLG